MHASHGLAWSVANVVANVALCVSRKVVDNDKPEGQRAATCWILWVLLKVGEGHEATGINPATAQAVSPTGHHTEFKTLFAGSTEQL